MSRLRVLHVTPYAAGAWAYGGIPRVADALATGLARQGHAITVCTTDAGDASTRLDGADRAWGAWPAATRDDGVVVRVFPNVSNRLAYHAQGFLPLGLTRFLREHRQHFDVAHLHACRNLPGVVAGRVMRNAGIPYVVAPNGTAPIIERRFAAKRLFDATVGRDFLRHASRVLAVTEAERRQLRSLGLPDEAIATVPNPVHIEPAALGAARHTPRAEPGPVVAYLGKITPRKRLDVLIRAFAHLRSTQPAYARARLVIAGNDMGAGDAARALVARCGLSGCTSFTGLLRGDDRLRLLAHADVVAYASEDEIFGLVPLEAILCGAPVVVAGDSGAGEVIASVGGGLIVPPGDVARLAAAIARLTSADRDGVNMEAAARRIRARFSVDAVCDTLTGIYHEAVAAARGTAAPAAPATLRVERHRMLAVVPAHNEAANLPRVIADLRAHHPGLDVLVVDDGSSDGTQDVLARLGVKWLTWEERRGIGASMRAALRYAARHGFELVVRVDADGQHGAEDIAAVVGPIVDAQAEVVLGSRFTVRRRVPRGPVAWIQWVLDGCLSTITRRRVTDSTSGFCALGADAIRVLAEHHPTGYPEPELRLFLSRNAVRVLEVPVPTRHRLSGRTSLTPARTLAAAARVLLAMLIVPLRPTVLPPRD